MTGYLRKIAWFFAVFLTFAAMAEAQPSWDATATVGSFGNAPRTPHAPYGDDWYFNGRYAVSIGKYWTDHIKTELEFAGSGEGSRYVQRFLDVDVPGVPPQYTVGAQEFYRVQQLSARVVYQFYDNAWVHPYVFGGAGVDFVRRRSEVPEQFYYSTNGPLTPANRILVTRALNTEPHLEREPSAVFGTGAKMYMTLRSYFNAAAITSYSQSARTLSFVAGFGFDF